MHHAGNLQAEERRCSRWWRVEAAALQDVGPVDGRRMHAHEQIFGSGNRVWNFGQLDDFWSAEALQIYA